MRLSAPIRSTAIATVEYDDETGILDVTFTNGRSYTHEGVPGDVYGSFVGASSPGSYYNTAIKGRY